MNFKDWAPEDSSIALHVAEQSRKCLEAYRINKLLVKQDANIERATAQGGYGRRQIYELVQNGADALLDSERGDRIHVVLTEKALYCANEGRPIDAEGVDAILTSHISMKRGAEIGRFGLGFKSVLGVSRSPAFFSRSGSFGFDSDSAAAAIRGIVPDAERVPTLRVAKPLSIHREVELDPVLEELANWATTVVRLPRLEDGTSWLAEDIKQFPAEFLLFSPHVGLLKLEDRTCSRTREIRLRRAGQHYRLEEDGASSEWAVFSAIHRPSQAARGDAGELADRDEIPLVWAVPTRGKQVRGKFWAFFPTEYVTTVSGILNAPWKTNEDRQNLLPGPFNEELLGVFADLIVNNLQYLVSKADPGRILDCLPARGREAPNWADSSLGQIVYEKAKDRPSLPDQQGGLRKPRELKIHPSAAALSSRFDPAWLEKWEDYVGRPVGWVHSSVETRERRPRADRLMADAGVSPAQLHQWLEALVEDRTAKASIFAVRLAARIAAEAPALASRVREAKVVMTESGNFVASRPGEVFLRSRHDAVGGRFEYVHRSVAAAVEARDALKILEIAPVDPVGELKSILTRSLSELQGDGWENFWSIARQLEVRRAADVIRQSLRAPERVLRACNMKGQWCTLSELLRIGRVITAESRDDLEVALDATLHAADLDLMALLGVSDGPQQAAGSPREVWFGHYREDVLKRYYSSLPPRSSRPQAEYLVFREYPIPGPLTSMLKLSPDARARYVDCLLGVISDDQMLDWSLHHKSSQRYPEIGYEAPWKWLVLREGTLRTTLGVRVARECLGPASAAPIELFPVAICTDRGARALGLRLDPSADDEVLWADAYRKLLAAPQDGLIGAYCAYAVRHIVPPKKLICRVGRAHLEKSPEDIAVVGTQAELDAVSHNNTPAVLVSDASAAAMIVDRWKLQPARTAVRREVKAVASGATAPLLDEFPALAHLAGAKLSKIALQRCDLLEIHTVSSGGRHSRSCEYMMDGDVFHWAGGAGNVDLLLALSQELDLCLTVDDCDRIVSHRADQERRDIIASIRCCATHEQRLVALLGADAIRQRLPHSLLHVLETRGEDYSEDVLARSALAVFGIDVLKEFCAELEERGLNPPAAWSGSRAAVAFVTGLGFPLDFAGFEAAKRRPTVIVDGQTMLPPMHAFQSAIASNARAVLMRDRHSRGLLSMPTGAGKTRVAVQSIIDTVAAGHLGGPILWIAQSDELCEQAVTTWSYVWRAIGPSRRLAISRLWASNEASAVSGGELHVVVATIDKLAYCIADMDYEWLTRCTAVVIDEAHGSVAPKYTKVLDWLGLGRGRERCPLLGLTATPFRGTSESETRSLVNRYGGHRLDHGVFVGDPYLELQQQGVLAGVAHRILEGATVDLSQDELAQLRQTRLIPKAVEERIGSDNRRNGVLLQSIRELPKDWTVLLFAPSVESAQTLAALLTLEGLPAAAISAMTEPAARRHYVEEFRAGRLRVLTNYNVLTQGFDAPAVRAVYVARPTYSPNLYQQMIGRGLRGPLNGGKEQCLIVNVADNVSEYGERLAFYDFEYLWKKDA